MGEIDRGGNQVLSDGQSHGKSLIQFSVDGWDHVLSELSTMIHPSWVAQGMVHSFIELDKAVVHVINLVSFL